MKNSPFLIGCAQFSVFKSLKAGYTGTLCAFSLLGLAPENLKLWRRGREAARAPKGAQKNLPARVGEQKNKTFSLST